MICNRLQKAKEMMYRATMVRRLFVTTR